MYILYSIESVCRGSSRLAGAYSEGVPSRCVLCDLAAELLTHVGQVRCVTIGDAVNIGN